MVATEVMDFARDCPACQSSNSYHRGIKAAFNMVSCQECGTLYTSVLPAPSSAQDYDSYYTAANLSVPDFIHRRLDDIVANFEGYRLRNRLLEVGFGAGSFLQAAARASWVVEGVEVSKTAAEHLRAEGINTFCGELSEANYQEGSFDVVIASEILEHVPDPASMIREVARILRPGGLLWATTPNAKGLSSRLLGLQWSAVSPPEHLHLFSASGLRKLLSSEGFQRAQIHTESMNPFELMEKWRRQKTNGGDSYTGTDRVTTAYRLNEALLKSAPRRAVKSLMNGLLRLSLLGDSLKIAAER
jgi:SAM-dependent methyltransferase